MKSSTAGLLLVPEDRRRHGLVLPDDVRTNLSLPNLEALSAPLGWVRRDREMALCLDLMQRLRVRASGPGQVVGQLSGGNQQKVVVGKWLAQKPRVLIFDEPTRGVDVGAKAEVHQSLVQLASRGIAVMVISSELPEVLAVSDRIVTMRRGRITGEMPAAEASEERLMALMALDQRQGEAA